MASAPASLPPDRTWVQGVLPLGLIFFLFYYLMLSAGWVFGETGSYPPVIGMWVPNLVVGAIGLFLLVRNAKERPVRIEFLNRAVGILKKKLRPENADRSI